MAMLGGAARGSYLVFGYQDETISSILNLLVPSTELPKFNFYYDPMITILRQYHLDGIDLDIEEPVSVSVPLRLLRYLRRDMGPEFILSMAPVATSLIYNSSEKISGFSYFDLDSNATDLIRGDKLVSWYKTQFYSGFGDSSTPETYQYITSKGWDPARVVMGVLDNPNDGHGFVATKYVVDTIKKLRALYPTFGGIYGWDYFDAGLAEPVAEDSVAEPWQWVLKIGDALYGWLTRKGLVNRF
jgi:hypothetical protein